MLQEDVLGRGLEFVLPAAGAGGADGRLDAVGADLSGAAEDLDLARRLDHPQAVEVRRQVA